jgi:GAF domain-containing protein
VKQLDQLYPGLEAQTATGPIAAMGSSIEQLDLSTVVRTLQAVSREIDLEKLIEALMTNALEHAGAERGLLFLLRGWEHRIAAEATTRGDTVEVVLARAFLALPKFPESLLRYVIRKRESIILDDASAENQFSDDASIQATHLRSVLCLPLVKRGELTGVLPGEQPGTPRLHSGSACGTRTARLTGGNLHRKRPAIHRPEAGKQRTQKGGGRSTAEHRGT